MRAQLQSELFKQRTTATNLWLLLFMIVLIAAVVLLHIFSLGADALSTRDGDLKVLGLATTFGIIFTSLLGAMSVTGEIRSGLIRPTFLATPHRSRVIWAKVVASAIAGAVFVLIAELLTVGMGIAGLGVRGIHVAAGAGDFVQLVAGGAAAGAAWAAIGVGVGALVRNQIGATIGLVVWLLFGEMTLIGSFPSLGKFLPGSSAASLAGAMLQQTSSYLVAPAIGARLIAGYVAIAIVAGLVTTTRRDVAYRDRCSLTPNKTISQKAQIPGSGAR